MLLAAPFAACGDDDDTPETPDGNSGASGGGGLDGGMSGGGGRSGRGGSPAVMTTIECGSTTCMAPTAGMGFIEACCADEANSTCGTSVMGLTCAAPADPDPRCPSLDLMGVFMLASCCTADGQCGIDASQFGSGSCLSLAEAGEMGASMGLEFPEPRPCDEFDAGTDDGGL